MKTIFKNLPLNSEFSFGGSDWIKKSTRTAFLTEYKRTFYFRENDLCVCNQVTPVPTSSAVQS